MNGKHNILITGGTGYIGSELVDKLTAYGKFNIALIVRNLEKSRELFGESVSYLSLNEIQDFNPEIVVHLAAYSTSSDSEDEMLKLIDSNITFTALLMDALSGSDVKLFINTGSFSEYHFNNKNISPTYFYSATKTSARCIIEYFSKKHNFKLINAILYTVYGKKGPNKKIIDYAMDSLDSKIPVKMSRGNQILDFIHIDDVVNYYLNLICNHKSLDITQLDYFVGTGIGISIKELVEILEISTNRVANIQWGALTSRKVDTVKAVADVTKTTEDLHWTAKIDINSGLNKYLIINQGDELG